MKALLKFAALGALTAIAVNVYRRLQRVGRSPPDTGVQPLENMDTGTERDMVADTNTVVTGDPVEEQRQPQPQDWRGAQNVLE